MDINLAAFSNIKNMATWDEVYNKNLHHFKGVGDFGVPLSETALLQIPNAEPIIRQDEAINLIHCILLRMQKREPLKVAAILTTLPHFFQDTFKDWMETPQASINYITQFIGNNQG